MQARSLHADHVLTSEGWCSPGLVELDDAGTITAITRVERTPPEAERLHGFVVPGLPNLHSHAFQRALAGLTENAEPGQADSFWTWRTRMYALASKLQPEDLEVIAAQLYVELLEAGMTAIGEFHYVHHDIDGRRYDAPEELSLRIFAAAEATGIALTHLPVLYLHGGFGRAPLERQRRFVHADVDDFLGLWHRLVPLAAKTPHARLGVAPHSLRAVDPTELRAIVGAVRAHDPSTRIHIHVAEQEAEVEESITHLGARPVRFVADTLGLDDTWCLVHATHVDEGERRAIASCGAIAGLCPTTEANLGDGLFPARDFVGEGGRFGVGSDSHISVSATEELRWLEYGQRLFHRRRNLLLGTAAPDTRVSVGELLWREAAANGAHALAQPAGVLAPGRRADLVVLDPEHPRLVGHGPGTVLDAWIFGGADRAVRDVFVAGKRVITEGRHPARDRVRADFERVMRRLLSA